VGLSNEAIFTSTPPVVWADGMARQSQKIGYDKTEMVYKYKGVVFAVFKGII